MAEDDMAGDGVTSDPADPTPRARRTERLAPEPVESLAGVLDLEVPSDGTVPPLWHWLYLLDRRPQRDLSPDGHPDTGIPAPPGPGRRRMFAGGRVTTLAPLRLGREATRTTWVTDTREKQGRSGPLRFVTVRIQIEQDGRTAVVEEQDIVYREPVGSLPPAATEGGPPPVRGPSLELEVTPALLFRFSALTYNAHRIHYDHEWVRREGYADLVVHGPLQALLMGDLARRHGISLVGREFAYRLVAPMVGPQRLRVQAGADGLDAGAETRSQKGVVTAVSTLI